MSPFAGNKALLGDHDIRDVWLLATQDNNTKPVPLHSRELTYLIPPALLKLFSFLPRVGYVRSLGGKFPWLYVAFYPASGVKNWTSHSKAQAAAEWCSAALQRMAFQLELRKTGGGGRKPLGWNWRFIPLDGSEILNNPPFWMYK